MLKKIKYFLRYLFISDEKYTKYKFKKYLHYDLNLINPKSFNQKLQWLKLYDRTPLHTKCADKFLVRDYIKNKIGEDYLIPLILVTKNPKEINKMKLPNYPVVVKPNHSRGAYIIKNKNDYTFKDLQEKLSKELKNNFYYRTREWQYKNIEPQIIVEKLLIDEQGSIPKDYKFLCMNGKAKLIQVDSNRLNNHQKTLYNTKWEKQNFEFNFPRGEDIERPSNLEEMIKVSEILAKDFIFVRVDLYTINKKIYFGELTFHPAGGFGWFKPKEVDFQLGEMLTLPKKKN
ncbi:glycosyl transferase [Malaciobacter canalis]|uniref:Glycosyl transferase n=1 Tax=Malaciobacter canalis TaxID=1912871 RepID=A0ABX4LQ13_9BACT|nr:ATP-grasp fold amidoligase family protein [Malaciobacter canalis]PHO09813.1 glycosyl transferase [Malaciobacter canalis]QEE33432.1 glycosyltransferase [Malaciobacter canalis]